jgi:mobilome CxxCx(11)CxxC protein
MEAKSSQPSNGIPEEQRRECAESALRCFGTAYIFERRAIPIRKRLRWLTFLGIAGPAALGAVVATFSLGKAALAISVGLVGIIGIGQLILSIWALVAKWDDGLAYYTESKSANYRLADEYAKLMKAQCLAPQEFDMQFKQLETEGRLRTELDQRQDITDQEKRMGMRAGLRQYQRACAGCKTVPVSLRATECEICGKF